MTLKHYEKYGDQSEFCEFQRTHSIWGSKQWWWWLHGMEEWSDKNKNNHDSIVSVAETNATSTENNSAFDDASSGPLDDRSHVQQNQ